jgi:biotin synthase
VSHTSVTDRAEAARLADRRKSDRERPRWPREAVEELFKLPFAELMYRAQTVHRSHFDPTRIEVATLLSIKTGGCPEDCAYCPQSAHHATEMPTSKLMSVEEVVVQARAAKHNGADRFCMGAAWRSAQNRNMDRICDMISAVKAMGMQTCVTLGMLTQSQAEKLRAAGLDYYNHNLDTSPEYYGTIISTRSYQDRLDTLEYVRDAGINVCCGGIVGMGEGEVDRAGLIATLASLPVAPESVPINALVAVEGTPLAEKKPIDPIDFVRTIAAARVTMPKSVIRLSAGREKMSHETQALCFMAGANSIFLGEKLLTTKNAQIEDDKVLLRKLGLTTCSGIESMTGV